MIVVVTKNKKSINIKIDNKNIKHNNIYCVLIGNIYNLCDLGNFNKNLKDEAKILKLYKKYNDELFYKLNGEYALIIIDNGNIKLVRDKLGSKQLYYTVINDTFICTNNLKYIIDNYKDSLEINKQSLSNYLCYSYINEPNTIFKDVYKVMSGSIVFYDNKINTYKYYDIVKEYKKNKNKIKNIESAEVLLEQKLKNAIEVRVRDKKKVGVFLSAGIDSTLVASLLKELGVEVNTFTIGFIEVERNEADRAKEIAKYLNTNHHECYLDVDKTKELVKEMPKIYSEPFADPSIIPTLLLNKIAHNMDIILTGDGADQLFCGSNVYGTFNIKSRVRRTLMNIWKIILYKPKQIRLSNNVYITKKYCTSNFYDIIPKSYYNIKIMAKNQIKYMLFDLKTFLPNRLFTKVSMPSYKYNINLGHPFIDSDFVDCALKSKHKYKYYKKNKKYILKRILYRKIPKELLNNKKSGFGIPLKKWLYEIFYSDIAKYSNNESLIKQGLFDPCKISMEIDKLKNNKLNSEESYIMFSYYMFQLWYQEYIEDLWN